MFAFVVFAEHKNFAAAARELAISQPALHVKVRKLAEAIGVPLYNRVGRALELTCAGQAMARHGREVQRAGRRFLAELTDERTDIVLAAGRGAFLYVLDRALRRFPTRRWPLTLLPSRADEAVSAVRSARVDVAVAPRPSEESNLRIEKLLRVGQKLVVPSDHRFAKRKRLAVSDLEDVSLIATPSGRPHRIAVDAAMAEAGFAANVAFEADGWQLILSFVRAGLGAAIVNDYCDTPRGTVEIAISGFASFDLCIITRPQFAHAGVARLLELIRETA